MPIRFRSLVVLATLAAAVLSGCDSNPDAPTAPPSVIVSDSDSSTKPSQAKKSTKKAEDAPAEESKAQ
ncbi:hypothetical protein [Paludisphaera rhizosphaerae]|uniref:hypothetical protein n=1 Tax=Paludisphaera rhizosphaerae TaxID=2711216 RepID=UPI0013EB449B|nr:hypothetical protein [Paludisphaera rhizosphaerae]